MPRTIKINAAINDGGFTAVATTEKEFKKAGITAWTHSFHKPYALDWGEAKAKAKERIRNA